MQAVPWRWCARSILASRWGTMVAEALASRVGPATSTSAGLQNRCRPEARQAALACVAGTEGTSACNYGRLCGRLPVQGRDVGTILISEGLATSLRMRRHKPPTVAGLVLGEQQPLLYFILRVILS